MAIPVIIDIIAAAILLGFVISGAKRGLFRALAGLVMILVALIGARVAAEKLTTPTVELMRPVLEHRIEAKLDAALETPKESVQMPEEDTDADGLDARDLLALLGVGEERLDELVERVQENVRDTGVTILTAVAEAVAEPVLYSVIFLLAFLLLLVGLKLLARLLDLAMKLPVLHGANALGGGIVGALEGAAVLLLLTMLLLRLDVPLEESRILHIYVAWLS